jgi:hypothetical protein
MISLAILHALERSANRAVDNFIEMAPDKKEEIERQRYIMTTIPARPALAMAVIFGTFMIFLTLSQPDYLPIGIHSPLAASMVLAMLVF